MHYQQFKLRDPALISAFIGAYPFATIMVNGPISPIVAQTPAVFKKRGDSHGSLEFHLANANPITPLLENNTPITLIFQGPSAPISPSWYRARFPDPLSDRSRTAPTYNYVSLVVTGSVRRISLENMRSHIGELVSLMERDDGWRFSEIHDTTYSDWSAMIAGFSIETDEYDFTAQLSQEQSAEDREGVMAGLKRRGKAGDREVARLIGQIMKQELSFQPLTGGCDTPSARS